MTAWGLFFSLPFLVPLVASLAELYALAYAAYLIESGERAPRNALTEGIDRTVTFCWTHRYYWGVYALAMLVSLGCFTV